jgi:hypothetical protein
VSPGGWAVCGYQPGQLRGPEAVAVGHNHRPGAVEEAQPGDGVQREAAGGRDNVDGARRPCPRRLIGAQGPVPLQRHASHARIEQPFRADDLVIVAGVDDGHALLGRRRRPDGRRQAAHLVDVDNVRPFVPDDSPQKTVHLWIPGVDELPDNLFFGQRLAAPCQPPSRDCAAGRRELRKPSWFDWCVGCWFAVRGDGHDLEPLARYQPPA